MYIATPNGGGTGRHARFLLRWAMALIHEIQEDFDPTPREGSKGLQVVQFGLAADTEQESIAVMGVMLVPGTIYENPVPGVYDFQFGIRELSIVKGEVIAKPTDFSTESVQKFIRRPPSRIRLSTKGGGFTN
jgi:hypothetical protein